MSYKQTLAPLDPKEIPRFLNDELAKISRDLQDNANVVFYRTMPSTPNSLSVTNAASANWRVQGNVLLVSTSTTQTFTGLQRNTQSKLDRYREVVFINVGTGVAVLKNEAAESSASNRFSLVNSLSLSQNGAVVFWRDPFASRWRGISKL